MDGYRRVDDDPGAGALLDAMDATATWAATIELRAWERRHLRLTAGERLLDVGCGLGDAALALATDLGPAGAIVGIDASEAMLVAARTRAATAPCATRFTVGDALALDEPAAAFDAARCERTLQWLADPDRAVAELVRVLGPGGRFSLIDTDWSTLRLDVGDPTLEARVVAGLRDERRRPSNVGRRLGAIVGRAGGTVVAEHTATEVWTAWDPDTDAAPTGCFSMRSLAEDLVERGALAPPAADGFVEQVHDAARRGRFSMTLTMHAVAATT